jgi:hypothetical protein
MGVSIPPPSKNFIDQEGFASRLGIKLYIVILSDGGASTFHSDRSAAPSHSFFALREMIDSNRRCIITIILAELPIL